MYFKLSINFKWKLSDSQTHVKFARFIKIQLLSALSLHMTSVRAYVCLRTLESHYLFLVTDSNQFCLYVSRPNKPNPSALTLNLQVCLLKWKSRSQCFTIFHHHNHHPLCHHLYGNTPRWLHRNWPRWFLQSTSKRTLKFIFYFCFVF